MFRIANAHMITYSTSLLTLIWSQAQSWIFRWICKISKQINP